jgi:hypothetical protein
MDLDCSTSTAQMVSNSLDLVNDYHYDPITNIHYNSNRNLVHDNHQSSSMIVQSVDAPASPSRRIHSDEHYDGFTKVPYKKQQKVYNSNTNQHYNPARSQHHHQLNRVNYFNNSSQPGNTRIDTKSNLVQQNLPHEPSHHHHEISLAATKYAQTRYPFPPFIIRFASGNVKDKQAAEELSLYFKNQYQNDISFYNYRS